MSSIFAEDVWTVYVGGPGSGIMCPARVAKPQSHQKVNNKLRCIRK